MIQDIDFYFPFIVLFYGVIMSIVTSLPALRKLAEENLQSDMVAQLYSHRILGLICCTVGGLWTLQRLLIT